MDIFCEFFRNTERTGAIDAKVIGINAHVFITFTIHGDIYNLGIKIISCQNL